MTKRRYLRPVGVVVGLVLGAYAVFHGIKIRNYQDNKVSTGELRRPFDLIFAHMGRPPYLTVHGRTYLHVRGLPPHYLDVPNSNRILFVTGEDASLVFHLVDPVTGEAVEIPGKGATFGGDIGTPNRKAGEPFTDWIESASSGEIVLATRNDIVKVRIVLDVAKKTIKQQETIPLK